MKKRGISLIVLIITIVVLIIITSVSILTLTGENNIISQAMKASLKTEFSGYKESVNLGFLNSDSIAGNFDKLQIITDVSTYIPHLNEEYKDNIAIYNREIIFVGEASDDLKVVLEELEIKYYSTGSFEQVENMINYEILEENQKTGFDAAIPPVEGSDWELNGTKFNLGANTTYNEEGYFEQNVSVGTSNYIQTQPFIIDYDKSFTIEYVFTMDNLETNVGDIQMMSIQGVNPSFEHILFYTYSYSKEKWFSMYSPSRGMLNGDRNIEQGNTPSPLELDHTVITLGLVYDKEEGKIKQYVNGVLNKEETIRGSLSGETLVTWSNTRHNTASNGIDGQVYKFAFYEERVSDKQLLYNHELYLEKYGK